MTELDAVRLEVARGHGLPDSATAFLTGDTVERIEEQAAGLARLGASAPVDREPAAPDLLTTALAAKEERRRTLLASLTARRLQPRDAAGRFVRGFDGGARAPLPAPDDPEADHSALVGHLATQSHRHGSSDLGRPF